MILERYFLREVVMTLLGVTLLLLLILLSTTIVRLLAETAAGNYPASIVWQLLVYKVSSNITLIVPVAFFLSVLLALGRMYADSEVAVMQACGIGPGWLYRTIGMLAAALALLLMLFALFVAPWMDERSQQLMDEAEARSDLHWLAAGRFTPLGRSGGPLVYVESIAKDHQRLNNIFARAVEPDGRQMLVSAASAYQSIAEDGERYLVLVDGHRYMGALGSPEFEVVTFQENGIRLVEREVVARERRRDALPSALLLRSASPADQAELQWRLAMPISAFLLGLLAVPLSRSSPREGRYGRLFIGVVIAVVYDNLLLWTKSEIGKGMLAPALGTWVVHGAVLAIVVFIAWNQRRLAGPRMRPAA